MFSSPYLDWTIERIALNAKVVGGPHGDKDKMVAAASESSIILWSIQDGGSGNEIGEFLSDLIREFTTTAVKNRKLREIWPLCEKIEYTSGSK